MRTAASVLRYVAERRCPELGLQAAALLQGADSWQQFICLAASTEDW